MSNKNWKRFLTSAALAFAGLWAVAGSAQAAVVVSFDPAFGAGIPNLGFKGTATLDVSQACYSLGTGFQFVNVGGDCKVTVIRANVDFYNLANGPSFVFRQYDVPLASEADPYSLFVNGAYFDTATGEITGIDTYDSSKFRVQLIDSLASASPINFTGDMIMWFESGHFPTEGGRLEAAALASSLPGADGSGAFLATCSPSEFYCPVDKISNPATTTFVNDGSTGPVVTVPEPASLALVGLALAGLGLSRRRAAR